MATLKLYLIAGILLMVPAMAAEFDVLIRGGRLLDGSGTPWVYADLGIKGDRIAALGRLQGASAKTVIEAAGLYVSPGFI
ncbi:MAG: D-aminoacylase, partial [Opitutaceae bacterium]|nr:D-aminoacylase [Opitutaceae bacterium]